MLFTIGIIGKNNQEGGKKKCNFNLHLSNKWKIFNLKKNKKNKKSWLKILNIVTLSEIEIMVVEIHLAWNIKSNLWKWTSLLKIVQFFTAAD